MRKLGVRENHRKERPSHLLKVKVPLSQHSDKKCPLQGSMALLPPWSGPTALCEPLSCGFPVHPPPSHCLSPVSTHCPRTALCFSCVPFCLCLSLSLECTSPQNQLSPVFKTRPHSSFSMRLSSPAWSCTFGLTTHGMLGSCCPLLSRFISTGLSLYQQV